MKAMIPNALTLFRGIATFVIVALFFSSLSDRFTFIYILFLLAAISDFLDGYLARRWRVLSDFGVVCDPLFDKILVLTLIVLLYPANIVSPIILLILLVRDIATDVLRSHLQSQGMHTPAIFSAKLKTTFQMLMINFMLLSLAAPVIPYTSHIATIAGLFAILFSLWSGGLYVRRFMDLARKANASSNQ